MVRLFWKKIESCLSKLALGGVLFYQKVISPYLPSGCCKFKVSCSEYTKLAIIKDGVILGVLKGVIRLLSCHPFSAQFELEKN